MVIYENSVTGFMFPVEFGPTLLRCKCVFVLAWTLCMILECWDGVFICCGLEVVVNDYYQTCQFAFICFDFKMHLRSTENPIQSAEQCNSCHEMLGSRLNSPLLSHFAVVGALELFLYCTRTWVFLYYITLLADVEKRGTWKSAISTRGFLLNKGMKRGCLSCVQ